MDVLQVSWSHIHIYFELSVVPIMKMEMEIKTNAAIQMQCPFIQLNTLSLHILEIVYIMRIKVSTVFTLLTPQSHLRNRT